jgi:hypothetical protein
VYTDLTAGDDARVNPLRRITGFVYGQASERARPWTDRGAGRAAGRASAQAESEDSVCELRRPADVYAGVGVAGARHSESKGLSTPNLFLLATWV